MADINSKNLLIDPPSGWRYGFPKIIPPEQQGRALEWLVENNYPRHLIEELGEHFVCRYWEATEE